MARKAVLYVTVRMGRVWYLPFRRIDDLHITVRMWRVWI